MIPVQRPPVKGGASTGGCGNVCGATVGRGLDYYNHPLCDATFLDFLADYKTSLLLLKVETEEWTEIRDRECQQCLDKVPLKQYHPFNNTGRDGDSRCPNLLSMAPALPAIKRFFFLPKLWPNCFPSQRRPQYSILLLDHKVLIWGDFYGPSSFQ